MVALAEFTLIDQPQDFQLLSLLTIAHNAEGRFQTAIHLLAMAGLPELVYDGFRAGAEWNGLVSLMSAYYGMGKIEKAGELAQFGLDSTMTVAVIDKSLVGWHEIDPEIVIGVVRIASG
jgi:hypothetical protein